MSANNNGFSLLESIAAFSIWCLAVLTLLPGIVSMMQERENSSLEIQAIKQLQNHTADRIMGQAFEEIVMFEEGGVQYKIQNDPEQSCMYWNDATGKKREICFQIH
ncbi:type II secretion system protein [Metabacillus sp. KIGAM252]|uniref:Type II secretion system protein n=1 Tax=Metabacillus flavus TaxID=2823519 RepID=A0ABS5LFY8_9BACI|nr:type II secretion system protein [Metabacillus flavus]MBS2969670.1 type II secretion system protein [Metabacillus flavus]